MKRISSSLKSGVGLFFCLLGACSTSPKVDSQPASAVPGAATPDAVVPSPVPPLDPAGSLPAAPQEPSAEALEPYVCPVSSGRCTVVSGFGTRKIPGKTETERHDGVCLRIAEGQSVRAARSGKVIFAGFSKEYASRANKKEQSRLVIVRHADGQSTRYVHLNSLSVRPPQDVKAGAVLGTAANSDEWPESVLHFEIRDVTGKPVNPAPLLKPKTAS